MSYPLALFRQAPQFTIGVSVKFGVNSTQHLVSFVPLSSWFELSGLGESSLKIPCTRLARSCPNSLHLGE